MKKKKKMLGFTLTELSVAIVFVSILLLTIAVVTLNMVHSYHKGLTMKSINTIGLALINEFSNAVSESPVFDAESLCKSLGSIGTKNGEEIYEGGTNGADACMNDGARDFYYQQFYADITVEKNGSSNETSLPTSGVFCTGKYSYIWNTGYVIQNREEDGNINNSHTKSSGFYSGGEPLTYIYYTYTVGGAEEEHKNPGFRLMKFADVGRNICRNNFPTEEGSGAKYPLSTGSTEREYSINYSIKTQGVISDELINTSDIAIYSLTINTPIINENSGRTLYTGSFVLGSITGDIDLNIDSGQEGKFSSCNLEKTSTFDVEYCATNKFNFAMRAMGG